MYFIGPLGTSHMCLTLLRGLGLGLGPAIEPFPILSYCQPLCVELVLRTHDDDVLGLFKLVLCIR